MIWLLALLFIPIAAGAQDFSCPADIKTTQALSFPVTGWRPFMDTMNANFLLSGVAFYDGAPEELASLVPDNEDSEDPPVWTFGKRVAGAAIWESCQYRETAVALVQKYPTRSRRAGFFPRKNRGVLCANWWIVNKRDRPSTALLEHDAP